MQIERRETQSLVDWIERIFGHDPNKLLKATTPGASARSPLKSRETHAIGCPSTGSAPFAAPQELAPFPSSHEKTGWLPRLLRAFPSAGLDKPLNLRQMQPARQAFRPDR